MRHRGRFVSVLQEFGLTPGDFRALMSLDADAPRPIGSLANAWDCDASNATWIVDRLEQRRLVERRQVPADRRVKAIALTPLGVKTKVRVLEALHRPPAEFAALDRTTLEQLRDTLAKLSTTEWGPDAGRASGAGRRRSPRSS
jgi:DNA-binding MarR family transcriptional regulator